MDERVILPRTEYDRLLQRISELEKALLRTQGELNELKQKPFKPVRPKKPKNKDKEGKDKEKKKTTPKKGGRKAGHKGAGRENPERIDRTVVVEVEKSCPTCGCAFNGIVNRERVVIDIEPVRPTVNTCYVIQRGWCPNCRVYHSAPVKEALPAHRFGFNLMLFVVYQKVGLGLSYGKIKKELALYFGLTISRGQLSNIVREVNQLFGGAYGDLLRLMRQQAALHIDETGWKVDGVNHWLWVFVNDVVALFVMSKSRGSKVPKAVLGTEFDGTIITDFFSAYSPLEVEKAKCWAHLLRESHKIATPPNGVPPPDPNSEVVRFHTELHQLYLKMGLSLQQVEADETTRTFLHSEMRTALSAFANTDWVDPDCKRLAKRIRKHLDELLVWLTTPDVTPDNNAAERALRPAVVTRKTSFGSRSKWGAQAFARLLSVILSWEKQSVDFFAEGKTILASAACS